MKRIFTLCLLAFLGTITVNAQNTGCFKTISAGGYHTVAIKNDGTLWSWGYNLHGQLGDGTNTSKNFPIQIGSETNWAKISVGGNHTIAIKTDGTLWAWGYNFNGQLGDGTNTSKNFPVQIGTATNWASISSGSLNNVALKTDGSLWSWGDNSSGQLGDGTTVDKNSPIQIGTATDWASVIAGFYHTIAIKTDGSLWAWGWNGFGQLGDGTNVYKISPIQIGTATNWASVSAGYQHTLAFKTDGTLWAWGNRGSGALGDGTNTNSQRSPIQIGTATNWMSLISGNSFNLAIKTDGTLWAWGYNGEGELGDGTTTDKNTPVQIGVDTNWARIEVGEFHSVAIKTDGSLFTWGINNNGQLGDGTTINKNTPTGITCPLSACTPTTSTNTKSACDSFYWADKNKWYYTNNNTDTVHLTNAGGCDSVVTLDLTVNHSSTFTNTQVACDSFYWADKHQWYYASNNTDTVHLTNAGGCDSLVTLDLTVNHSSTFTNTQVACDSFYWADKLQWYYASNNTDTVHLTNLGGCDSLVTLNLTINHSASSTFTTSSCGSYTWVLKNNKVYTSSNHTDTVHLKTVNGCDSLITLDLTILANITDVHINGVGAYCGDTAITQLGTNINSTYGSVTYQWIRLGYDETTWQVVSTDSVVNVSDVYPAQYVVKTVIAGCGTFYSNQQTVMPVKSPTVALNPSPVTSICNNNIVNFTASSADSGINKYEFFDGNSFVQIGSGLSYTTPTLTTANNGVVYSVRATNTKPTFDGNIAENFWGKPLAVSTGGPSAGFGAGHELNAVYARTDADNVYLAIAGNVQNSNRIMVFIDSKSGGYNNGNYGRTGLSINSIKNFNSGNIFDPGFNADYCLGIGTDATRSQFYFDLFTLGGTASGGGGTNNYIGSNLSPATGYSIGANPVNNSQTNGFEVAIPKSALGYTSGDIRIFLLYSSDGGYLSNQFLTRAKANEGNYGSGIVNFALATPNPIDIPVGSLQNKCQSTAATTVTVKPNYTSLTTLHACDSLVWNGATYKTSGTYTFISTGSNNCDSIATLNLTVGHPSTSSLTTPACDSLVWNGVTYFTSGTYTYITANASGCDSVATLNLTVNHPTASTTTTSSCDSMIWGNTTYYASGTYTYTTTGSNGCDSVATLNLTINNGPAQPSITTSTANVTIPATGVAYGCTTVSGAVSYVWSYTGTGVTITSGQLTENITADFASNATLGNIQVIAVSSNSCNSPTATVSVTLPVTLTNFTAEKANKIALIKWTTATEVNSKNFEVQRSIDGVIFTTIGAVVAKGFASNYSFVDEKPFAGTNYYRLKEVDKDGKFNLSIVKTVNFKPETLSVSIYPNPVKDILNVKLTNGIAKQIRVLSSLGEVVYQSNENRVSYTVNLETMTKGTYFVEVITNDNKIVEKFVKN